MSEARPRALVVDPRFSSETPYVRLLRQHFDVVPAFTPCEGLAELDAHGDRSTGFDIVVSRRDHLPELVQTLKHGFTGLVVTAGTLINAELQVIRETAGANDGESAGRTAVLRLQADMLMPSGRQSFYTL